MKYDKNSRYTIELELETKTISSLFSEYCDSSSIHGVRYIGHFDRPLYERILWLIVIVLCVYGSIKFSVDVIDKWQNHPIIVSFEDTSTPISKIPFPAVTICPGIKVRTKYFSFSKIYKAISKNNITIDNLSDDEFDIFQSLLNVKGCDLQTDKIHRRMNKTIVEVLLKIAPKFDEVFHECWWEDRKVDCEKIWNQTLTMDGVCYTFNSMGNENIFRSDTLHEEYIIGRYTPKYANWIPEVGYTENPDDTENYPHNIGTAGFEVGLYVELKGSPDDFDSDCGSIFPGFKMMIHAPNEVADAEKNFIRIPFENEVLVAVKPSVRHTSPDLINIPYQKRQCFFESERYLQHFTYYTEINCLIECWANYSLNLCGCVEFNIPRTIETPVCNTNYRNCIRKAFDTLLLNESGHGICHCLPSCTSYKYDMEPSSSAIAPDQTEDFNKILMTSTGMKEHLQYATLTVYFKEDQFWSAKRSALFGKTEVMANCGGVLGLFLGVSVLSLVEILYFATFRLIRFFIERKYVAK